MVCSAVFSSAAMILHSQIKCVVSGLRLSAAHELTVLSEMLSLLASAVCVSLLFLSLILSHRPNVISSPRMVWATLPSGHQQVYLYPRVWG